MKGLRSCLLFVFCLCFLPSLSCAAMWPPAATTFGGGFGVQIKGGLADDLNLTRIRALGFHYVRFSIGWSDVEKTRGGYDWDESDELITRVRRHGLKMVIPLLGGNALYGGTVAAPIINTDHVDKRPRAPVRPEDIDAYARFVAQMVLRYGPHDIVWEIWNEPDLARFWPPQPKADVFSVLAEVACQSMRRVAADAIIIGPALGRIPDARDRVTPDYMNVFLSSGAARCVDAISVHPYRHGNEAPEAAYGDYSVLIGMLARHKFYGPLVNSEWGYTTTQVSLDEQASFVLRTRLTDMIWGVPLSIWYEWKDSREDPQDPEGHFGLIEIEGQDKPAMEGLERLLPLLQDATLEQQVATENPRDILVVLKQPDGEKVLVGWSLRSPQDGIAQVVLDQDHVGKAHVLTATPSLLASGKEFSDVVVNSR